MPLSPNEVNGSRNRIGILRCALNDGGLATLDGGGAHSRQQRRQRLEPVHHPRAVPMEVAAVNQDDTTTKRRRQQWLQLVDILGVEFVGLVGQQHKIRPQFQRAAQADSSRAPDRP